MPSRIVKRTIRFRVSWDEDKPGSRQHGRKLVDEIMRSRDYPIPFEVSGYSVEFGSYRITRVFS